MTKTETKCKNCPLLKSGVCNEHAAFIFEMRIRKWAERFIATLLVALFGTIGGLFWKISAFSDNIRVEITEQGVETRKQLVEFFTKLEVIGTKQVDVLRRLEKIENKK